MDTKTLKALIAEAKKNERSAARAFKRHDNHEDMQAEEMWGDTVRWLEAKLTA